MNPELDPRPAPRPLREARALSRGALPAVLLLALGLRLAVVLWLSDTVPYSDYYYYHEAARLAAHRWSFFFDRAQLQQFGKLGWWPPGYPIFLAGLYAVLGASHRAAVFVQVLLGTLVCGLAYRIGERAAGGAVEGERVGLAAALLVAVDPTYVFTANLLASENLYAVWLALGLWLAAREWRSARGYAATGFVLGLGTLTRAIGLGLPLVVVLWLRRRLRGGGAWRAGAAWLLAAYTATLAPWTLRNALVAGSPAIVCFGGGLNFYFGHSDAPSGYRRLSETPMAGLQSAAEIDRLGWRLGLRHVARHPLQFVTGGVRKIAALFAPPGYALRANSAILPPGSRAEVGPEPGAAAVLSSQRPRDRALGGVCTVLASVHSYLLLSGALAACLLLWRHMPSELRLSAYVALYWIAAHAVFWAQPRFRYPVEIPLALLAGFAIARLLGRGSRARMASRGTLPGGLRGRAALATLPA